MRSELEVKISKAIDSIGCIYPSFGAALYDEPRNRLAQRICSIVEEHLEPSPPKHTVLVVGTEEAAREIAKGLSPDIIVHAPEDSMPSVDPEILPLTAQPADCWFETMADIRHKEQENAPSREYRSKKDRRNHR
jgi:hypothetical protein